jgi:hypothetical protein
MTIRDYQRRFVAQGASIAAQQITNASGLAGTTAGCLEAPAAPLRRIHNRIWK